MLWGVKQIDEIYIKIFDKLLLIDKTDENENNKGLTEYKNNIKDLLPYLDSNSEDAKWLDKVIETIKNTIDNIIYTYNLTIPEKTITKFVYPKNSLYIGGLVGQGNISPMVMYTNKGKYNYLVSYNLVRSEVSAGVIIKIR